MSAVKKKKKPRNRGLGRGLDALLGDAPDWRESTEEAGRSPGQASGAPVSTLPIEFLAANPDQPRQSFSDGAIDELAASLKSCGMLQPILVRPRGPRSYQIVAGERRWRAAQRAGLHEVPAIIRDLSDIEAAEVALIENVQRVDLSAIEEAAAYASLAEVHGRSQDEIAAAVGKSRSHVANTMRLNALSAKCRAALEEGVITAGHARALLGAEDPDAALAIVLRRRLNVRDTERLARGGLSTSIQSASKGPASSFPPGRKDADTRALENNLASTLGLEVTIEHKPKGSGVLVINYRSLDQLDDVCKRLMGTGV